MPGGGGLVVHDAALERHRNEVAMANARSQYARSSPYAKPLMVDPNSKFMRKMKAATVERNIQISEQQKRDEKGESALHHAGRGAQEAMFDLLELRHGADSELCNHAGEPPKLSAQPCRVQ